MIVVVWWSSGGRLAVVWWSSGGRLTLSKSRWAIALRASRSSAVPVLSDEERRKREERSGGDDVEIVRETPVDVEEQRKDPLAYEQKLNNKMAAVEGAAA